jgi:hypothetical protein
MKKGFKTVPNEKMGDESNINRKVLLSERGADFYL